MQFAKAGYLTTVWLRAASALDDRGSEIVVLDAVSRAVAPTRAHASLRDFLEKVDVRAPREIIKKIDSTLRGNLAAELRAILEALPEAFAVVAPAYPANGRTCRDGLLYVHGVRVDETDFARDPASPVRDARVDAHLGVPSVTVALAAVRSGPDALARIIAEARAAGIRAAVVDAESDADLRALAALEDHRDDVVWAGSAGLMEVLAARSARASNPPAIPHAEGPVVLLVGSVSAMTQRQIAAFALDPAAHTELLDPAVLLEGGAPLERALARAAAAVARGADTLIVLDAAGDRAHDAHALRTRLAATADRIVPSDGAATVVLSGGDCARAFCERRGIRGMTLLAEVAPGIPISRAIGAKLFLVTKAGGFGDPQTYRSLVAALHGANTA